MALGTQRVRHVSILSKLSIQATLPGVTGLPGGLLVSYPASLLSPCILRCLTRAGMNIIKQQLWYQLWYRQGQIHFSLR